MRVWQIWWLEEERLSLHRLLEVRAMSSEAAQYADANRNLGALPSRNWSPRVGLQRWWPNAFVRIDMGRGPARPDANPEDIAEVPKITEIGGIGKGSSYRARLGKFSPK